MIRSFLSKNNFLDLLFPPACLVCEESLPRQALLCEACLSYLILLDPLLQCPRCFGSLLPHHSCDKQKMKAVAYCFENSPISALFQDPCLTETALSYLLIQFSRLSWKIDLVSFIPLHPLRTLISSLVQDKVLAKTFARRLKLPFASLLKAFSDENWVFYSSHDLAGKSILLVGLREKDIAQAVECLKEEFPCHIYGLFLIRG